MFEKGMIRKTRRIKKPDGKGADGNRFGDWKNTYKDISSDNESQEYTEESFFEDPD